MTCSSNFTSACASSAKITGLCALCGAAHITGTRQCQSNLTCSYKASKGPTAAASYSITYRIKYFVYQLIIKTVTAPYAQGSCQQSLTIASERLSFSRENFPVATKRWKGKAFTRCYFAALPSSFLSSAVSFIKMSSQRRRSKIRKAR